MRVILIHFALTLLLAGCAQEYAQEELQCPCDDDWKCCLSETLVNACVPEGSSCPCSGMVGEMNVDPEQGPANGNMMSEVVILVFEVCGGRRALGGIDVKLHSSRNQGGNELDYFEQPTGPTDADGRVVSYVSSYSPGEATLFATANGEVLCKTWSDTGCFEPVEMDIVFVQ